MAAAFVALVPFLKPPMLLLPAVVLAMQISLIRERSVNYQLCGVLLTALSLPVIASWVWPRAQWSALFVFPAFPWLIEILGRAAGSLGEISGATALGGLPLRLPKDRLMTPYLSAMTSGLLIVSLIGLIANLTVMAVGALLLLGCLGALVVSSYLRLPADFLVVQPQTVRLLAGDTLEVPLTVQARIHFPLRVTFEPPNPWTAIIPSTALINGQRTEARIKVTPPLAGPSTISTTAWTVDPWGLTFARQTVSLIRLRVIPRASYAAWLARRYLEEARGGTEAPLATIDVADLSRPRRGLEYYGARPYEPGDGLKDIFWKQLAKLRQYVVKDRRDDQGTPVLIAVSLEAEDPEEADSLAYTLLTATLTVAREGIPLSFAAYTEGAIIASTPPLDPRAAVLQALALVERIHTAPRSVRVLAAPSIVRLRRTIVRLMATQRDPALRLARVLSLEHRALQHRARAHPASEAIWRAIRFLSSPALLLIVSATPDESTIIELSLERMQRTGIRSMLLRPSLDGHLNGKPRAEQTVGAGSGVR